MKHWADGKLKLIDIKDIPLYRLASQRKYVRRSALPDDVLLDFSMFDSEGNYIRRKKS